MGKSRGITVNSVAPGVILTDYTKTMLLGENNERKEMAHWVTGLTRAEDRLGLPEDVADVVLFVVSEKSRWLTAQNIEVSGGMMM